MKDREEEMMKIVLRVNPCKHQGLLASYTESVVAGWTEFVWEEQIRVAIVVISTSLSPAPYQTAIQ